MKRNGFTLIEIMVSVTIFSIVVVLSLGALLSVSAAEKKAETVKSVTDSLNFALDSMSRAIHTGQNFDCRPSPSSPPSPTNCLSGYTVFAFRAADHSLPDCNTISGICYVKYCLGSGSTCSTSGTSILRSVSTDVSSGTLIPITSSDVRISNFMFYVQGACSKSGTGGCTSDSVQPKVTITLSGEITISSAQKTSFNLQTSITQRIYDL